ncbi:tetratricopeptide repeat protein [Leptospira interrogans]|uniref:Tetratricopeptide repeat protein n=2 Tax=Leptospira interrogans TaxID=173 RepID=A0A0F6I9D5_LEPIR|nr:MULTISPECIES: tetratricopeptide repeat protein [Leptospira]ASV05486.1 tetratricopeptide repeat protein [Leptospira interrogans serovar Canicola]ASV08929.1 tetratricopeptide repeat protein [Leptospira interrogans serovar Canicola]EJO80099.1 tetratricopeptide repeat protein [Leptospira interrogans serovar Pomona str. Kennewicki LC82-25]EKN95955.1 tetratricopeptide repeat protein [Leptospira interrogans serovar Pomona str. Pomona]EKO71882.1 tetratricopeptide repeat protein [Leptospira interrog
MVFSSLNRFFFRGKFVKFADLYKVRFFCSFFSTFLLISSFGNLVSRELVYAFRDPGKPEKEKMILVGETVLYDKVKPIEEKGKNKHLDIGVDTRADLVTIKINFDPGLRVGQTLYLIEKDFDHKNYKNGNIVAQIEIKSIFQTSFIGKRARGIGNLSLVKNKNLMVAAPLASEKAEPAIVERKMGDYHLSRNEIAEAIRSYKHTISLDPSSPMGHFRLGLLYKKTGEAYISAGSEFSMAWNNRKRFENSQEELEFYTEYIDYLNHKYDTEGFKNQSILSKSMEVIQEAFKLTRSDSELLTHSALTYYYLYKEKSKSGPSSMDRKKSDSYFEISEKLIKNATQLNPSDYRNYLLASKLYIDKISELTSDTGQSGLGESEEIGILKNKFADSLEKYKVFKPASVPGDPYVLKSLN